MAGLGNAARAAARIGRLLLAALGTVVFIGVFTIIGIVGFLATDRGRDAAVARLREALAPDLVLGRVDGSLLGRMTIERLAVRDAAGPWLVIEGATLAWRPWSLLAGRLTVTEAVAADVAVARRPRAKEGGGAPLRLPLAVEVSRLAVARLALAEPVAGVPAVLEATGEAMARPNGAIRLGLAATRVDGQAGRLVLSARADPGRDRLDLSAEVSEPAGGLIASTLGLPGRPPVEVTLRGSGPAGDWNGVLSAAAGADLSLGGQVHLALGAEPAGGFDGAARLAGLVPERVRPAVGGEVPISLRVTRRGGAVLVRGEADLAGGRAALDGRYLTGPKTVTAEAELSSDGERAVALSQALAPLTLAEGRLTLRAEGPAASPAVTAVLAVNEVALPQGTASALTAEAEAAPAPDGMPVWLVTGSGTLLDPRPADPAQADRLAPLVGESVRFGLDGTLAPAAGEARLAEAILESDAVTALARGRANRRDGLALTYEISAPDLAPVGAAAGTVLSGRAAVAGSVAGPLDDPTLTADLTADGLVYGQHALGVARASVRAETVATRPHGTMTARLRLPDAPELAAASAWSLQGRRLTLDDVAVTNDAGGSLRGSLALRLDRRLAEGRIAGPTGALAPWSDLAGRPLAGTGALDIALSEKNGLQAIDAKAEVTDAGLPVGASTIESLRLGVSGAMPELGYQVALSGVGPEREPLALAGGGRVSLAGDRRQVVLGSLSGRLGTEPVRLLAPATVAAAAGGWEVRGLHLGIGAGRIDLDGSLAPQRLTAVVEARRLPVGLARLFAPAFDAAGSLSATVRLTGSMTQPAANFSADVRQLALARWRAQDIPPLTLRGTGRWDGRRLTMSGTVAGIGGRPIEASASVPLVATGVGLAVEVPGDGPVEGRVAWAGPVEPLWRMFGPAENILTGRLAAEVNAGGTVAAPRLGGNATLAGGNYQNTLSGTVLANLEATATAEPATGAVTIRATASDGHDGRAWFDGTVDLASADKPSRARLTFENMNVVRRDDVTAHGDGDLTFSGSGLAGTVSGNVTGNRVEYRLDHPLPPSVVRLDVVEINRPPGQAPPPGADREPSPGRGGKEGGGPLAKVALDLAVDLPGRVLVRGRGLDSEWHGQGTVGGTLAKPTLDGRFSLAEGTFMALGKTFQLTEGTVDLDPGEPPRFQLVAERKAGEVTARVVASGTPEKPKVEWTSDPPMPHDEVLARMLFGKGSGQISPVQALQLAQLAGSGAGPLGEAAGAGEGVLERVRSGLGLDVLRLEEAGPNNGLGAIGAGEYITDRTYVGIRQSLGSATPGVVVDIEIGPRLSVETELGVEPTAGLRWRMDY